MTEIICLDNIKGELKDANGVLVNSKTIQQMIDGAMVLLPKFCQLWHIQVPKISLATGGYKPKPGEWIFNFIDVDPNTPDALGYHYEDSKDNIQANILCKTIIDAGGFVLCDKSIATELPEGKTELLIHASEQSTISGCWFHELVEALVDPFTNCYWQTGDTPMSVIGQDGKVTHPPPTFHGGSTVVCAETGDPVQQNIVIVSLHDKTLVALSDFILPSWTDPECKRRPFNYADTLPASFNVDIGGYSIIMNNKGGTTQVFSEKMPKHVRQMKEHSRRSKKRKVCHANE